MRRSLIILCVAVTASPSADAAPPDVKAILPAGGQRGQTVTVTVTGNVGAPPAAVWCSRPEIKVEPAAEAGKYTVQIPADAAPGVCRLRWHNADGPSAQRAFVIGTLPEIVEKEPNNDLASAAPLESSRVVVNGVLDKNGEVDVFAVNVKKGETLVASLDANRSLGSPMDGVLQIVSAKGFVLEQNDDGPGYDPFVTHSVEADGTYYVRVFAFPTEPNTNVVFHGGPDYVYRLTLSNGPTVDYAAPMVVQRGVSTPVKLRGWNLASVPGEATVAAAAGDEFPLIRDDLTNAVPLRVVDHPSLVETEPATAAAPMKITVPATVTGVIGARREADVYEFTATKGQRIVFDSEARPLGSLLDPILRVTDAAGKTLAEVDDAKRNVPDSEITWGAPADGTYRIEIRDLYEDGGPRYFYRLTVEPEKPDATISVAADAFALPGDKPLEIPVTIEREAGYSETLEISVLGLPDSLAAEPVKSMKGGETEKAAKLVINRKTGDGVAAPPAGAPLRIVARAATAPPLERFADAPQTGSKTERTRDFWLTIAPKK